MPRIVVFGNPGAGKSTFARGLARELGLPFISLDALFWKPGWIQRDHAEFRQLAEPLLAQQHYVVDGNYFTPLGDDRMKPADRLYWFDMPNWLCIIGVLRRVLSGYGRVRPEMADGCPERLDFDFLRFVWNYPARNRDKFNAMIERSNPGGKLTRFTRHCDVDAELRRIAREGLA